MESHPESTISREVWQTWAEENKPEIESSQKKSEESFSWNIAETNNSITGENIFSENISEEEKSSHEKSREEAEESDIWNSEYYDYNKLYYDETSHQKMKSSAQRPLK